MVHGIIVDPHIIRAVERNARTPVVVLWFNAVNSG